MPLLIAAGALAGSGKINLALTMGSAIIAALLAADVFWYYVGGYRGGRVLKLLCPLDGSIERQAQQQFLVRNFGGGHRMIQQRCLRYRNKSRIGRGNASTLRPNGLFLIRRSD